MHGIGTKKMMLVLFYHARFLTGARLNIEENLYLHHIAESKYIHYLQNSSGRLSAIFCLCNLPSECPAVIGQPAVLHLPWYRFSMVEISC
jgi:hypothetical protein